MYTAVNLNDQVRFKLTPIGQAMLESYYHRIWNNDLVPWAQAEKLIKASLATYEPETDGYSHTQLWDFMAIFGAEMRMGMTAPIVGMSLEVLHED